MDSATLQSLGRPALQKLAKENNIKANLKSNIIIELLLERQTTKTSVSLRKSLSKSPRRASTRRSIRSTPLHSLKTKAALKTALPSPNDRHKSSEPRHAEIPIDVDQFVDQTDQDIHAPEDSPHFENSEEEAEYQHYLEYGTPAPTAYTFGTPESSLAGSPEPEAPEEVLHATVESMAAINEIDLKTLEKIAKLRRVAALVRSKAEALRSSIRAERATRQRIHNYLAYWRRIDPNWKFEEVWTGVMRIQDQYSAIEITTSDEEYLDVQPPVEQGLTATLVVGANEVKRARIEGITSVLSTESNTTGLDAAEKRLTDVIQGGALEITMQLPAPGSQANGKRRRDDMENVEDEIRYQPRARSEERQPSTGDFIPASSPTQKRLQKGKAKMSARQVEEMLRQHPGRWNIHIPENTQLELQAGDLHVALGLTPEDVEYDAAVTELYNRIDREGTLRGSGLDVPAVMPAAGPVNSTLLLPPSPQRVTRRSARATSRAPAT